MKAMHTLFLLLISQLSFSTAFMSPSRMVHVNHDIRISETHHISTLPPSLSQQTTKYPSALKMGFNLPPSNPKDAEMKSILTGIGSIALATAFFLSPLGSIFFAITNSFFLLLFLLPIIAGVGFNAWQYFYTIEGPCPSCGAPARVLKDEDGQPGLCLNCGSTIRATIDKKGIELCNGPDDIFDDDNLGSFSSVFDLFRDDFNPDGPRRQDNKVQKKSKIIDVEVKRDD